MIFIAFMEDQYYLLPHHDANKWQEALNILSSDCNDADNLTSIIEQLSDVYTSILPKNQGGTS
jgi:hypothetical protein